MIFKYFIIIISFFSLCDAKEICSTGEISYIFKQKKVIQNLEFCFDKDKRDNYIYSKNCMGLSCKEVQNPHEKPLILSKYKHSIGSPGFKVCRELGGSPQIINFKIKNESHQGSRCIFNDTTFVSNNLLMKIWKDYILY